jgi:uncharacterized DUF497 family protein
LKKWQSAYLIVSASEKIGKYSDTSTKARKRPASVRTDIFPGHTHLRLNLTRLLISRSMMGLEFEWHETKAEANLIAHGVSFELAKTVFKDPFAIERLDDREPYGEDRYVIIGIAEGNVVLYLAYTEREHRIRIISARRATQYEQDDYFRQNS